MPAVGKFISKYVNLSCVFCPVRGYLSCPALFAQTYTKRNAVSYKYILKCPKKLAKLCTTY